MIDRLRHSMRAMQMFMRAQDVTANNLANMNTPGYKGVKLFYRAFADEMNGQQVSGVEAHQTMQMQQGAFEATSNPFDFAIEGEGFFVVENDNGQFLTRDGRFQLDAEGYLVDKQGAQVQGESGPIHLPQLLKTGSTNYDTNVNVAKDGTVKLDGNTVGKIKVVKVDQVHTLQRQTNSYLSLGEGTEAHSDPNSQIMQGYYEKGNVDPLVEMIDMSKNMRMFESQQRAMRTMDEMLSQASSRLGRF